VEPDHGLHVGGRHAHPREHLVKITRRGARLATRAERPDGAGVAVFAAVEPAVDEKAAADPVGEVDQDGVAEPSAIAGHPLGEDRGVGIVLGHHPPAERFLEDRCDVEAIPGLEPSRGDQP
jgi:hypothetical protein